MIKLRLRRERFQKTTQATTQISSIIRLRNGCGWPFNLVGCSKVAHLESKKKSTQKTSFHHFSGINTAPNQLFSRIRVKETHFFFFFLHLFARRFFPIYGNKFTMCDPQKP